MQQGLRHQRDRVSLYLLFSLFVLLPLTVVFGHRGVAPWLLLASFPAFARGDFWQSAFGQLFDNSEFRNPFFIGLAAILFFCVWVFLSGFWSPGGGPSLAFYVLAPVLVGGSVIWFALNLTKVWSYRLSYAYAASIAAGMAVLLFEGVSGGVLRSLLPGDHTAHSHTKDIISLGRGVTALVPALFPAAIIVSFIWNRYVSLALLTLGVTAAFANDVSANAIAISAGLVGGILTFKAPKSMIFLAGWALIIALLAAPLAMFLPVDAIFHSLGGKMEPSWLHRIAVWQFVGEQIPEGLPFGFGADYTRALKEAAPMVNVPGARIPLELAPTHPHNLFLQVWLELGLPGVLSLAVFFYSGMKVLLRTTVPVAIDATLIGLLAAIAVSISVEGSMWQVWRFAAMALAGMGAALAFSVHKHWGEE